ncbi:MAG: PQQ-binding-like beta-propeller repeat protein [Actinomycetota bacterium]|nr:PQQ-binding-like beta-propeller repeat protein [Actinomycetota bacterium]
MTLSTVGLAAPALADWPIYHGDAGHTGYDASAGDLRSMSTAWTSPALDGQLYGSPVIAGGTLVVGTENNTVYAFDSATGAPRWTRHLATPVSSTSLPCGNITPAVGITSTPVIDVGTGKVFVVADEATPGGPQHHLFGLDLGSGTVTLDRVVDVAGSLPAAHLQRAGLALSAGRVVLTYGGNAGDCAQYQGRVVASSEDGTGALLSYTVPTPREGGIWAPAGPAVDSAGNIYVAVGNGESTTTYDGSDSVTKLSPTLAQIGIFAPSGWAAENAGDTDLGSSMPQLLPGGYLFQAGKSGTGYLVSTTNLGGIGGQKFSGLVCKSFGGQAFANGTIYVSCTDGVRALAYDASAPSFRQLWHATTSANGAPILAGGLVWSVNAGSGTLYGLDPGTGATVLTRSLGAGSNHFPTPASDGGRLFVALGTHVTAFLGASPIPAKYQSLGGASSFLGTAVGPEYDVADGRGQDYQGGAIFWSPAQGAYEVHGALLAHYRALGGPAGLLGFPTTDETGTPDGVGRYNHFTGGSAYWTPNTGAHEVHGAIRDKWTSLGWETGVLGYPTTDETGTPDGVGRYNQFTGGSVYWTPGTGAHEVHGALRALWASLGWENGLLGYPVSDELTTPDGVGRANQFTAGWAYWTLGTGAHEVHGAIFAKWTSLGWERGFLGYPTSNEYGVPGGRRSDFQGGWIFWNSVTGSTTAGRY